MLIMLEVLFAGEKYIKQWSFLVLVNGFNFLFNYTNIMCFLKRPHFLSSLYSHNVPHFLKFAPIPHLRVRDLDLRARGDIHKLHIYGGVPRPSERRDALGDTVRPISGRVALLRTVPPPNLSISAALPWRRR